jgi:hypothetical protein
MLTRFSLLFQLRKLKSKQNGTAPIYLRIAVKDSVVELSSKKYINPARWNAYTQKVIGNSEEARLINAYLKNMEQQAFQVYHELIQKGVEITTANLKSRLLGEEVDRRNIIEIFREHNMKVAALVGKQYAELTLERYETSLKHTQAFIQSKYGSDDLDITKLDYEFIENYEFWLKSVRNCDHNTAMKYLGNFKDRPNLYKERLVTKRSFLWI